VNAITGAPLNKAEVAQQFYELYFITILQELLNVTTDSFHKTSLRVQCEILMLLFHLLGSNVILRQLAVNDNVLSAPNNNSPPRFTKEQVMNMKNQDYVKNYVGYFFSCTYPNLIGEQIKKFIEGLFAYSQDINKMMHHVRQFLSQLKQFAGDINWLYLDDLEEQKEMMKDEKRRFDVVVPGLLQVEDDDKVYE
jgi:exportin-1